MINLLTDYYRHRKLAVHVDDHFTIPDSTLSAESRAAYIDFPDDVKERMQRMQIQYHVEVIKNYPNTLIAGWHIEEAVYTSVYGDDPDSSYYRNYHYRAQRGYETQVMEARLPDIVMIHVTANDDVIKERMETAPHEYQIINQRIFLHSKVSLKRRLTNLCSPKKDVKLCWIQLIRHLLNRWMSCFCYRNRSSHSVNLLSVR